MKISCVICAGTVQDDYFVAVPCGHTFHHTCLEQWLVHQKSCPQCRERCLPRQTLRLYLDDPNISLNTTSQFDDLSAHDLKERLQEHDHLNKQKDEALLKARQELEEIRQEVKAWQTQYDGAKFKIDKEKAIKESLKHQLQLLQSERDMFEKKASEVESLKTKLGKLKKIQLILSGDRDDAQEVIVGSSLSSLSSYLIALKSEYESIKERKMSVQREKDEYSHNITDLKRKLRSQEMELQATKSNLNTTSSDLHSTEIERDNLKKKVQLLEKALESPNSRTTLQRILESPMPEALAKKPKLEVGNDSSPQLGQSTHEQENKLSIPKELMNSAGVLLPVPKLPTRAFSSSITSGFNGLGGHSKFLVPKSKHDLQTRKQHKFAPRSTTTSTKSTMPAVKLKLKF